MSKIKKVFGCILITVVIWAISRFIPGVVSVLLPGSFLPKALALIVTLPLGWLAASKISKGRFSGCIRVNLYLFVFIEAAGVFELISYILRNLSYSTGRYNYDANGIAYSNYPIVFGGAILFEIVYIALCILLAKKASVSARKEQTQAEEIKEKG